MATAKLVLTDCKVEKHNKVELTFNGAIRIQGTYHRSPQGYKLSIPHGLIQRDYVKEDILKALDDALAAIK